uniref:Uncharacterized protein n=1 Tax=Rhipicephalus zambeziensis TaxID=60191 RepID=A0A224YAU8_9ACAR
MVQGRTNARRTRKIGTKHHVQERKGRGGGQETVRQSLRCFDETKHLRFARVVTTSHGDEDAHHTSMGPSWTLEWRLSASAYCHTRCLVHMSKLKRGFRAISFSFFLFFVHTPNIAR